MHVLQGFKNNWVVIHVVCDNTVWPTTLYETEMQTNLIITACCKDSAVMAVWQVDVICPVCVHVCIRERERWTERGRERDNKLTGNDQSNKDNNRIRWYKDCTLCSSAVMLTVVLTKQQQAPQLHCNTSSVSMNAGNPQNLNIVIKIKLVVVHAPLEKKTNSLKYG